MIPVTRLNGEEVIINADMIEFIDVTPDTVISMISGKNILVTEPLNVVLTRIIAYKQKLYKGPQFARKNYCRMNKRTQ